MKAIVHDWYTDIFPTDEDIKTLCKPATSDACVWLTCGSKGFECVYLHRPHVLLDRWSKGETNAKRDGCEQVKQFEPYGSEGEVDVPAIVPAGAKLQTCAECCEPWEVCSWPCPDEIPEQRRMK